MNTIKSKVTDLLEVEYGEYRLVYVYEIGLLLNRCIEEMSEVLRLLAKLEREWLDVTNIEDGLPISTIVEILDIVLD